MHFLIYTVMLNFLIFLNLNYFIEYNVLFDLLVQFTALAKNLMPRATNEKLQILKKLVLLAF